MSKYQSELNFNSEYGSIFRETLSSQYLVFIFAAIKPLCEVIKDGECRSAVTGPIRTYDDVA